MIALAVRFVANFGTSIITIATGCYSPSASVSVVTITPLCTVVICFLRCSKVALVGTTSIAGADGACRTGLG